MIAIGVAADVADGDIRGEVVECHHGVRVWNDRDGVDGGGVSIRVGLRDAQLGTDAGRALGIVGWTRGLKR